MAAKVFIDGEAGTTGLQIRERLAGRRDVELISLPEAERKDPERRGALLNAADVVVLCLPDEAAREAVGLIENPDVKVIDASSAHRVDPAWVYGFAEMAPGQGERIAAARRVSNPGCYPTGAVALIRPLVAAGLLPEAFPVAVNAVSGYSGGGRRLIERYEDAAAADPVASAYRIYGLGLEHKHTEEIRVQGLLAERPLFVPGVGRYRQGMLVQLPLQLWALPGTPSVAQVHGALAEWYRGQAFVTVAGLPEAAAVEQLDPEGLNGSNDMRLYVFGNDTRRQALLVAVLDNLGKGASGAAVQNLNLMLGITQRTGLDERRVA